MIWGAPPGTDDTYYFRLLDGGLPVFRTFGNCVKAVRAYVDYWEFAGTVPLAVHGRADRAAPAAAQARRVLAAGAPGEALSEHVSKQLLEAYGMRSTSRRALRRARRGRASGEVDRLPGRDEGVVARPAAQERPRPRAGRGRVRATRSVRVYDELMRKARRAGGKRARVDGVLVCETVSGGVETVVGVSHDPLFGPVVMVGLGGVFVEVLRDVTFRVPPFDRDEADAHGARAGGLRAARRRTRPKPADVDALVDVIMNVQRLAMDLAGDVAELDINPLVVRPRGAVALDALVVRT